MYIKYAEALIDEVYSDEFLLHQHFYIQPTDRSGVIGNPIYSYTLVKLFLCVEYIL